MVIYPNDGILHNNENKFIRTTHNNLEESHKYKVEQKKPDTKRMYCVIPFTESTITGKTKLWGEKSRHQLPLGEQ